MSVPGAAKENQDHYKFCLGCGAELPREAAKKEFVARNTVNTDPPVAVRPGAPRSRRLRSLRRRPLRQATCSSRRRSKAMRSRPPWHRGAPRSLSLRARSRGGFGARACSSPAARPRACGRPRRRAQLPRVRQSRAARLQVLRHVRPSHDAGRRSAAAAVRRGRGAGCAAAARPHGVSRAASSC